jgi:hypothetical protein
MVDSHLLENLPTRYVDSAFWLAGPMFVEWGHFVNTYLIKLNNYLEHSDWPKTKVLVPDDMPTHLEYIIKRLIPPERLLFISRYEKIFMVTCYYFPSTVFSPTNIRNYATVVPSHVYIDPYQFKKLYKMLNNRFNSNIENNFDGKKIFWSRGTFSRRNLINRSEVEDLLTMHDYISFDPLSHDPLTQFNVLKNAESICGEIGSWIYLAALNKKCRVILIISDWDQQSWHIGILNNILENPLKFILGERIIKYDYKSENAPHAPYRLSKRALSELDLYLSR